jgi:hypothetical protein
MRSWISSRGIVLAAALLIAEGAQADPRPFSLYGLAGWEPKTFLGRGHTSYKAVPDGRIQVVQADCDDSASGLTWRDRIDLEKTPILAWRWKIESVFEGLNERHKTGDDFPARVYAVRGGGALWWKARTIVYVWSNGDQGLEDWPDPYTDAAHVVPVRSGAAGVGEWQSQQRDLREDFRKYFGLELKTLDAVALMTDCDDHHDKVRAWYGDLRLLGARQ